MEGLVGLIILIISVIGWVANAINEQKAKQPPQQQGGGRPRPQRRLQDEIESFLKEIQQQQGDQGKQEREPERQEERPRAVRDRRPQPAAREKTQRPPKPTRKPRRKPASASTPPRSSREQEQRQPSKSAQPRPSAFETSELSVSDKDVSHFLTREFEEGPSRDLRDILNPEQLLALKKLAKKNAVPAGRTNVADMLTSENIGTAFVINEILQRPRSMR